MSFFFCHCHLPFVIFENKVTAIGSKQKPIIFKKNINSKNWGTVAFHGQNTNGSILKNLIIEDGSVNQLMV